MSGKDGCSLSPTVDGSGVGHGKVDGCGQGRAEQHCTLMHLCTYALGEVGGGTPKLLQGVPCPIGGPG